MIAGVFLGPSLLGLFFPEVAGRLFPADMMKVDGTPAKYLCFRGMDRQVSQDTLDRRGGILTVASGRVSGKVVISVMSYQPGQQNTQSGLRQVIADTMGEFGLSGEIA